MTTFATRRGDIFTSTADVLVNPVNCVGVMGAGLARSYARYWPAMAREYSQRCRRGEVQIGRIDLHQVHHHFQDRPLLVANLPTKRHWRNPSEADWVQQGLDALAAYLRANPQITSVAVPALGSGLGNLRWSSVRPMILATLDGIEDLKVEVHPPQ